MKVLEIDVHLLLILITIIGVGNIGLMQWVKNFRPHGTAREYALLGFIGACLGAFICTSTLIPRAVAVMYIIILGIITIQQLGYEAIVQGFGRLVDGAIDKIAGSNHASKT